MLSATVRYLYSSLIDIMGYNEENCAVPSYLHFLVSQRDEKMMCFRATSKERFVKKWQVTNLFILRRPFDGVLRLSDSFSEFCLNFSVSFIILAPVRFSGPVINVMSIFF